MAGSYNEPRGEDRIEDEPCQGFNPENATSLHIVLIFILELLGRDRNRQTGFEDHINENPVMQEVRAVTGQQEYLFWYSWDPEFVRLLFVSNFIIMDAVEHEVAKPERVN